MHTSYTKDKYLLHIGKRNSLLIVQFGHENKVRWSAVSCINASKLRYQLFRHYNSCSTSEAWREGRFKLDESIASNLFFFYFAMSPRLARIHPNGTNMNFAHSQFCLILSHVYIIYEILQSCNGRQHKRTNVYLVSGEHLLVLSRICIFIYTDRKFVLKHIFIISFVLSVKTLLLYLEILDVNIISKAKKLIWQMSIYCLVTRLNFLANVLSD